MRDKPAHRIDNSGGTYISLQRLLTSSVRTFRMPGLISKESGAEATNSTYLLDNSRLLSKFDLQYRPLQKAMLQIINGQQHRRDVALPLLGQDLVVGTYACNPSRSFAAMHESESGTEPSVGRRHRGNSAAGGRSGRKAAISFPQLVRQPLTQML
jgi:hypothetical protein